MAQILRRGSKNLNTENWKIFHPVTKKHMSTCGDQRATWYLNNNLAELYPEKGDKSILLSFIPKGHGFDEDDIFGLSGRVIACVVTREEESLQRHHIVPYCYRKHFSEAYKSKNHHDVVLVTYDIHQEYERHATIYKNQMAVEYNVKTLNECNLAFTLMITEFSREKTKMLSSLHSLFRAYGKLSQQRIDEILVNVAEVTELSLEFVRSLNYVQLYKLYLIIKKEHTEDFEKFKEAKSLEYDHGYQVVKQLDTHEKIEEFVQKWRKHFIETMKPPYMPEGWRVDYRVKVNI